MDIEPSDPIVQSIETGVQEVTNAFDLTNRLVVADTPNFAVEVHTLASGIKLMVSAPKVINTALYMGEMTQAELNYMRQFPQDPTLSIAFLSSFRMSGQGTVPNAISLMRRHNFKQAVIVPPAALGVVTSFISGLLGGSARAFTYSQLQDGIKWIKGIESQIIGQ